MTREPHSVELVYTRGVWRAWCSCGRWQLTTTRADGIWTGHDAHTAAL